MRTKDGSRLLKIHSLEPRLGERFEPGMEREQPLAVARDVAALVQALKAGAGPIRRLRPSCSIIPREEIFTANSQIPASAYN